VETHAVDLVEQIVRELDVRLVDFVDQEDHALTPRERTTQWPELDVAADVFYVTVAKARVVEALDGVVDVKTILRACGRLHRPMDDREPEALGDGLRQQRFPGSGFSLH